MDLSLGWMSSPHGCAISVGVGRDLRWGRVRRLERWCLVGLVGSLDRLKYLCRLACVCVVVFGVTDALVLFDCLVNRLVEGWGVTVFLLGCLSVLGEVVWWVRGWFLR